MQSWRRRHLRLVGANLVAYNDVTKKVTATIDLRKAVAVEDDGVAKGVLSPQSGVSSRSRHVDELDIPYGGERSFRLVFLRDQEITFYADTEEEKARWYVWLFIRDCLRGLIMDTGLIYYASSLEGFRSTRYGQRWCGKGNRRLQGTSQ